MKEWLWGIRSQVSLLLEHGHQEARSYPVGMVWEEAIIVVGRINSMLATNTTLLHQVMTVAVGAFGKDGGKAAHANLLKTLKRLTADGS